ncbi:MAG: hypothetical protein QW789_03510 [Nitrososphaerota archaeon]|uniref:Uncharacterized protein n=1 Tax=Fervidobacterium pennivorans TaxID=93466 RepID=A0A7V4FGP9_FERPE
MIIIIKSILSGILAGFITAALGYAKSVTVETFDWEKFLQTLIIGGFVGACSAHLGLSFTEAYEYLFAVGAITLFEYVKKSIWRIIKKLLQK